jgi:hypothetical protein
MVDIEKEFYSLLVAFHKNNVLKYLVLIGSWALKVYAENFKVKHFPFKTTDVDFSINDPRSVKKEASPSVHDILIEKGYTPEFGLISNVEKYIPSPGSTENQLNIDFLCEYGRHIKEPFTINGLGIKVTPIVYQHVLLDNIVNFRYKELLVNVPEPGFWAAHKIAISQKRSGKDAEIKMIKDLEGARVVVESLGDTNIIRASDRYPGKFKKLFDKGWKIYQDKFKIDTIIKEPNS